jgi:hypothetical protein
LANGERIRRASDMLHRIVTVTLLAQCHTNGFSRCLLCTRLPPIGLSKKSFMTAPEASNSSFAWALLWSCQLPNPSRLSVLKALFKTYLSNYDRGYMVPQVLYALFDGRLSPAGWWYAGMISMFNGRFRMLRRHAYFLPPKRRNAVASSVMLHESARSR